MRNATRILVWVVIIVAASQACAARNRPEEDPMQRGTSTDCYLHRIDDGSVWLGEPLISLGMIGVGGEPQYRLSDDLARSLDPLINRFPAGTSTRLYCWHQIPRAREADAPTVLVTFRRVSRLIAPETQPKEVSAEKAFSERTRLYEIVTADVLQVEVIPRAWLEAWDQLDKALKEIVDTSKAAPGPDKRKHLVEAIDKGCEVLRRMCDAIPPEEKVRAIRAALPKARLVRNLERRVEQEWGGHLRQYISALAIQPSKPLPPEPRACTGMDRMKILLESDSPSAFIVKIKQACPPEDLDEALTYSMLRGIVQAGGGQLSQPIYVWEVEQMTSSDFETLKDERKRYADMPRPRNVPTPEEEAQKAAATLKDKWGVAVRPADASVLSKSLILQGLAVDVVAETGSPVGFQKGDVIVDYDTTHDLRAGETPFDWRTKRLAQGTPYASKLLVIRAGQMVTLHINKGK